MTPVGVIAIAVALVSVALAFSFPRRHYPDQHIFLIRHGDKMSKYPKCTAASVGLCYDATAFGNNPPLSPCGHDQSRLLADYLATQGIRAVVSSPFARALHTALPLAEALRLRIKVEPLVSEDRQEADAFRQLNTRTAPELTDRLIQAWDTEYSSPPIATPEGNEEFWDRMDTAAATLVRRFPPSVGNVAVFSHATPVMSLGYGLCGNLFHSLEDYVAWVKPGVAAAGFLHAVRDGSSGLCTALAPANNTIFATAACGLTRHSHKEYTKRPGMYSRPPEGIGSGGRGTYRVRSSAHDDGEA